MSFLKHLILDNLTLKVTAVLLAFLLWLQIAGQQEVQRMVAVPVEFVNMPSGIEITNDYPKEVNVLIARPGSIRMDESQLAAVVDLSSAEPGVNVVPITERSIRNLPFGVSIEGIEQRRIRLQLERTRRKIVRIEPQLVGRLAEGFEIREVRLNPSEVLISGPESRVERVATAETESIDVEGRRESFTRRVYLDLEDTRLRIENTASVDAVVIIEEERREVEAKIAVRPSRSLAGVRGIPRTVATVLSLPVSFAQELDISQFAATVDLPPGAQPGEQLELAPIVVIPRVYQGIVRVESVDPATFTIQY